MPSTKEKLLDIQAAFALAAITGAGYAVYRYIVGEIGLIFCLIAVAVDIASIYIELLILIKYQDRDMSKNVKTARLILGYIVLIFLADMIYF